MAKSRSYSGLITFIVLAAAAGGGWYYWQSHRDKGPEYYTTTVSKGDVVQSVTAAGTIKPLLDVLVSSQISGYVTWWGPDFNAKVKKGDLLATLLPTSYQAAVQSATAALANAKANYDLQKVNLDRDKKLLDKGLLAQSDYDTESAMVEEAQAQIQINQASLDTAQTNLGYCQIKSPLDGFIIARDIDVGNSVSASLSSPTLYEIGNDLTQMQIDASVAEADVGNVAVGQDVDFSVDAYPNRAFHGTVYQVRNAPQTQQNVVIYDVMIKVPNNDLKLKPGMTANASIIITRKTDVLRVSNGALRFRMPDGIAVTTIEDPAAAKNGDAAPAKQVSRDEQRKILQEIMQEAGYVRGNGPPPPAVLKKMTDLAKERGIELPERILGGSRAATGGGDAPVFRNVYRLPANALPGAKPELIRVQIGITDGANTELISPLLNVGDVVITGMNSPGPNVAGGSASPFGGGGGGGGRGGPAGLPRF